MNWNYWLPWRTYPDDSKDSTPEIVVIDECNHEFTDFEADESADEVPVIGDWEHPMTIENGHLVLSTRVEGTSTCKKFGIEAADMKIKDGNIAIPIAYRLADDVTLAEALDDPDEEPGRVLVNKEEQADDSPIAAGGATD